MAAYLIFGWVYSSVAAQILGLVLIACLHVAVALAVPFMFVEAVLLTHAFGELLGPLRLDPNKLRDF